QCVQARRKIPGRRRNRPHRLEIDDLPKMLGAAAWRSLEAAAIAAGAVAVALVGFGVFVALGGIDPLAVYGVLYLGAFGTWFSLEATLTQAAPLMLTALCTAIPARAGLLVIGGEGALVIGGLAAVLAGIGLGSAPPALGTALTLAAGAAA